MAVHLLNKKQLMKDSTKDIVQGKTKEIQGKLKEATGVLSGSPRLKDEGRAQKVAGKVQNKACLSGWHTAALFWMRDVT